MARLKGSKNKNSGETPLYSTLPTEERLVVIANLIVDRILEDQADGGRLLNQLRRKSYASNTT
jgi:hypothetical protein